MRSIIINNQFLFDDDVVVVRYRTGTSSFICCLGGLFELSVHTRRKGREKNESTWVRTDSNYSRLWNCVLVSKVRSRKVVNY